MWRPEIIHSHLLEEWVTTSQTPFLGIGLCSGQSFFRCFHAMSHAREKYLMLSVETNQRRKPLPTTTTSWNYTRIGNHWFPPSGIEQLSLERLQYIFLKENTSWRGASTARQDYHTMHAILSSNSVNVDVIELEQHINKGKRSRTLCHERYCPLRNWCDILVVSGQVFGYNCTASPNVRKSSTSSMTCPVWGGFLLCFSIWPAR